MKTIKIKRSRLNEMIAEEAKKLKLLNENKDKGSLTIEELLNTDEWKKLKKFAGFINLEAIKLGLPLLRKCYFRFETEDTIWITKYPKSKLNDLLMFGYALRADEVSEETMGIRLWWD